MEDENIEVVCKLCGGPGQMQIDLYSVDVHGDDTLIPICDQCNKANAEDI